MLSKQLRRRPKAKPEMPEIRTGLTTTTTTTTTQYDQGESLDRTVERRLVSAFVYGDEIAT